MPRPFVDLFIDYTKEAESPESFFRWAAFAVVAAILKNSVWLDLGVTKIWPNIYVILMARSAHCRKSGPLKKVHPLLKAINNTKVIFGRSSIQAVVKELSQGETDKNTGVPKLSATGIILSEELSSFSPEDPATIPILTDLYDNHPEWTNSLIGQGKTTLRDTCITLLGASNEPLFRQVYNMLAIRGGLLGRTFIVREERKRKINSLMYPEIEDTEAWLHHAKSMQDNTEVVSALRDISKIQGPIILDLAARKEFDRWYNDLNKDIERWTQGSDAGVVDRIHAGIWKISMIIAISTSYDKIVKKYHMEEAIGLCMGLLKNYEVLTMGSGKGATADPLSILLAYLFSEGGRASVKRVMRNNWQHFDAKLLDDNLIPTLERAGLVKQIMKPASEEGPELQLTDEGMRRFQGAMKT